MLSANDPARSDYIDGLRAIAVGSVLCFHAGLPGVPSGFLGVDVFFVISGFLITAQIFDGVSAGSFSIMHFYARRILRIWPPLFVVIAATVIASCLLPILPLDIKRIAVSAIASAAMVSNWYFLQHSGYFAPAAEREPLLHIWSLGVEEQYYLFVPALVLALAVIARRRTMNLYTVGLVVTAGALLSSLAAAFAFAASKPEAVFYATPIRAWEFAVGAGAVLAIRRGLTLNRPMARIGLLFGVAAIGVACVLWSAAPLDQLLLQLLAVGGAGVAILSGAFAQGGAMTSLLSLRPMVGIGLVSYSLYLWHWPLLALWRLTHLDPATLVERVSAGIVIPLLLAILTYAFVELPMRRLRRSLVAPSVRGRAVALGIGASAVVGLLAFAVVGWSMHLSNTERFRPYAEAASSAADPCPAGTGAAGPSAQCASPADAAPNVMLWGDSHARAIWAAVAGAAKISGRSAQLQWEGNCPPLFDTAIYVDNTPWARCRSVNDTVIRWLSSSELKGVTGVVLTANWRNSQTLLHAAADPADRAAKLGEAVGRTLTALRALGLRVLVLGQVPPLPYAAPECVYRAGLAGDVNRCSAILSTIEAEQHDLTAALRAAVAPFDNTRYLDLTAALCDDKACSPVAGDRITYSDITHLSDSGARAVREHFALDFAWVFAGSERDKFSAAR